ncbi:MAG: hypothetical protein H7Z43_04865, partial [Clostridia bacterium]|nr:hypothetical protein [Deltaproteobacteria bacterium]
MSCPLLRAYDDLAPLEIAADGDFLALMAATCGPQIVGESDMPTCLSSPTFCRSILRPSLDYYFARLSSSIASTSHDEYDVIIVGGGMLSLHVIEAINDSRLRVLIVEAQRGARPFAEAGDAFRLNTDVEHSEPYTSVNVLREDFALASFCFDALRVGWVRTEAQVWCGACVELACRDSGCWNIHIRHRGQTTKLTSRHLIVATGFGAPKCQFSALNYLSGDAVLTQASWDGLRSMPWWRDGYRLAVVGAGPTSFCVLELLTGLGPSALRGWVDFAALRGDIHWYTGGPTTVSAIIDRFSGSSSSARMLARRYRPCLDVLADFERAGVLQLHAAGSYFTHFDATIDCTGYPSTNDLSWLNF